MNRRRVVVTGLGLVTPVGNSVEAAWANILAGKSGVGTITKFDATDYACTIAAEVKDFDIEQYISAKEARHMDTFIHYGMAAAAQAIADAKIPVKDALTPDLASRIGCLLTSGIGGLPLIEETGKELSSRGPRRISPFFVPASIINMVAGQVSIHHGFMGPNFSLVSACTSGVHSIGMAARLIACGDADIIVAGGAEAAVCGLGVGGFAAARALSKRNDAPTAASRPWDKDRDGFVLGEGAGVMVLESYESAVARGVTIYAELIGFGASADAHHMTSPSVGGPMQSMASALKDAGLTPADIQYINAHGTSTPLGDVNETQAIKATFGEAAYRLVCSSTKSMTGHLLGGAGGIESVFTVLAIHHQIAPPTINLDNPDPECDLDYCAHKARPMSIEAALKNNFGFGGTNGSLVFRKV